MFKIDDRVVLPKTSNLKTYNEYEDDCTRGKVVQITQEGKFVVKWDSSWHKPNPSSHLANELMLESEADEILSKLEAEYESYATPIREKMKQAAQLLKEAGEIANKGDRDLTTWLDVTSPLIRAMDNLGWRTSSLEC